MAFETLYLLYLDDFHAGDPLFLHSLSRGLSRPGTAGRIVIHGSGEEAQRALESEGIFRMRSQGIIPVESAVEHALVERAIRRLNQKIVGILTEGVVSAVGVMGTQRRLLVVRGGLLEAGDTTWLLQVVEQGVVPVVAAYAAEADTDRTGEVFLAEAVAALASGIPNVGVEVVFFTKTNLPGIMRGGEPIREMELRKVDLPNIVLDADGLNAVAERGHRILITNTTRFADPSGPVGTRLVS
jgi:acetylglutamate kinase